MPADVLDRALAIEQVCAEFGVPLPVAALQFPLREAAVRAVVVGGGEPHHVRENAARLVAPVPPDLWVRLAAEGLVRQ